VFGLLLMLGVFRGLMANRIRWMPTITAFMLLGFLTGPHGLGLISKQMLADSTIFINIALGLILYKLGNMLHPEAMLKSRKLMAASLLESAVSFVLVFALILALGYGEVVAALIGAIAVSSSPSVLLHVSEEMRAKGPVTSRAKSLVALNNLFSFIIFSAVLPFAMAPHAEALSSAILVPVYRLCGAALVGIGTAWLAVRIARVFRPQDAHYRFALVIGAVMMTLGLCKMLAMSALFAPLVLGTATRWFETSKHNLSRVGFGEGGDLFFIVLFVMAGAKIDPVILMTTGFVPLLLVIVRSAGKAAGIFMVARYARLGRTDAAATSLLLMPMAGMAIGLVTALSRLVPEMSTQISAIVFAMVAIFETVGPFATAKAFTMTDEAGKDERLRGT